MGRNDRPLDRAACERFQASVERDPRPLRGLFPAWDAPAWQHWTPPAEIPPAIRFGQGEVSLARIEGGLPDGRPPAAGRRATSPCRSCSLSRGIRCCC